MTDLKSEITTAENKPTARAWLFVAMLCLVGCLNYLDRIMITTMRSSIVESIPMTDGQFGLLTSAFLWVYGLLSPFAGYMADRFNRSRVIVFSLLIWSAVTWLTAHASTFPELLATRVLMGISEACYIPAALALISDYHRGSTRSLATGLHMTGIMAGQSLGFIGGMLAENHSWNYAFSLFGIVGIVYTLILAPVLKDAPERLDASDSGPEASVNLMDGLANLFRSAAFCRALGFWGLLGVAGWMIVGWLPTFYKEHFNLSQSTAGLYATGYIHTVGLAGVLAGGWLADQWSRTNPRARLLVPALGMLVSAPCVFLGSTTPDLTIAIGCFMIYAFMKAFSDANMMPILCLIADPRYRATGYGILNFCSCIIGGIGLYAAGFLRDGNIDLSIMFRLSALAMLLCAGLLFSIRLQKDE
jgi:predicted MFS family arabinose efflux permease